MTIWHTKREKLSRLISTRKITLKLSNVSTCSLKNLWYPIWTQSTAKWPAKRKSITFRSPLVVFSRTQSPTQAFNSLTTWLKRFGSFRKTGTTFKSKVDIRLRPSSLRRSGLRRHWIFHLNKQKRTFCHQLWTSDTNLAKWLPSLNKLTFQTCTKLKKPLKSFLKSSDRFK